MDVLKNGGISSEVSQSLLVLIFYTNAASAITRDFIFAKDARYVYYSVSLSG